MRHDSAKTILTAVALIGLVLPVHAVAGSPSFSLSDDEFRRLSSADQKAWVTRAFERRLEHAKNIHFESLTLMRINQYDGKKVGPLLTHLNGGRYRHWRLGESYRVDIDRGGNDVSHLEQQIVTGLDASAGVFKTTFRTPDDVFKTCRIDTEQDPLTIENRYAYWLDGGHNAMSEYLIRYLLEHRDSFKIDSPANGDIVLSVDWKPVWSDRPLGTRELILDPVKGFLPINGKAHWEKKGPDGKLNWRSEEFVVEKSQLVGDVWMPTKLTELLVASTLGPEIVNVFETEVTRIESGTVKPHDLEIPFLTGMKIVDAIKGVAYTVGPNGKSSGDDQPLVGQNSRAYNGLLGNTDQQRSMLARNFWAFVFINLGVVVTIGALVLRRHLRRRVLSN